ncbi:polysaccharide pyruvyl transferase family protein [Aromatoleum toluvorans]|uniref:Polysaccharide pyruvyl transferase family protein n=1 Tax=Aromatoleum toluvorans TaxID=92002 RepID=A0ABX1PX29_9RHOO|nr:polysaccharide pyruvyl transferase family protein [Aromatoleum toluvorans]NMG42774.1 polysaccharide pyruvyl transferase family protein [Aromatoleum toluvorans]
MTDAIRREAPADGRRVILFGAFDRHNFGDLLLARCAAAGRSGECVFAGLVARDLRDSGGFRTVPLATVIEAYGADEVDFVHVGGEVLTTTAWEAAVMLQRPEDVRRLLAAHDRSGTARDDWAAACLGTARRIPYVVAQDDLPRTWRTHFRGIGGVAFEALRAADRHSVLRALKGATTLGVRDRATFEALRRAGFDADLAPDPAAETRQLLGDLIRQRARQGEVASLQGSMQSWMAVQLAAEWGDDATLDGVAQLLLAEAVARGTGIVLFRAGLAPWHDDLETLRRLADRLETRVSVELFESAHVLDICALLAGARAYAGTSLHGWIVAHAFGVPARCLVRGPADKAACYLDTWCSVPRQWRTTGESAPLFPRTVSG